MYIWATGMSHRPCEKGKLMWAIFKGSSYNNVDYESVIRNHRQLICDNEVDYLYNVMQDCKDLMRSESPPRTQMGWGGGPAGPA